MILSLKIILFTVLFISVSSPVFPQAYKWKDKDGNPVFSDTLPSGVDPNKVKVLEQRETPTQKEEGIKPKEGTLKPASLITVQPKENRDYSNMK
jgi:hypothetical protein